MKCIKCRESFESDSKICSKCGKNNNIISVIWYVISSILLYGLSLTFLLLVFLIWAIDDNVKASLIMLIPAIFLCPFTYDFICKYIKFIKKWYVRTLLIIISFICAMNIWVSSDTVIADINDNNQNTVSDTQSKVENNVKSEEENKDNENNNKSVIKDIKSNEFGNSKIVDTNFDEAMINQFMGLGFNIEEATEMQNLFYKMGITSLSNIKSATNDVDINKLVSFVAVANNDSKKKFYFTVENRKMFYAGFQDEDLYDSAKGGVLKNINDIHIPETKVTMSEYTTLQDLAKKEVKNYLNYPDSANFPLYDGWGVGRNDNKYKIIGKVEAKNGFGVKEKINFSIWFIKENSNYTVEAVLIDGIRVK